jgi:hypothetical protein
MSGDPQRPLWLKRQERNAWLKTAGSAALLLRFLEIGRSAVAQPLELVFAFGFLVWTVWSWYSWRQNLRTWREMLAKPEDDLRA